jgi:urease accessory protein
VRGTTAARITPDDFHIPPEFAGLRLAGRMAGQVGGARLEFVAEAGRTRLGDYYHQVPVQVLPPSHFAGEPAALQYLMSPTVGLLDGDGHLLSLTARSGSRVVVTGQSASRIHPALDSFATQQWHVRVEDGAELVVLPGPAVPFRGSRYYQRVEIDLAPTARLVWADFWLPGRYLSEPPELFAFERIVQELHVRRAGRLVFRERFSWAGPWGPDERRWHLGLHLASAGLFVSGPVAREQLCQGDTLSVGLLPLAGGDTCVRLCGSPPDVVRVGARLALTIAAGWTGGQGAAPWLGSGHYGPGHWFA